MRLLNLCAGAVRPLTSEWVNLDTLHSSLLPGTPERSNLDLEPNYVNFDVASGPLPFPDEEFDSILFAHALEHFDCEQGIKIVNECFRILKKGGALVISVPDATYFRERYGVDTVENAEENFGEPIFLGDGETTFTGYALWCPGRHKAILTEDSVWHYYKRSGFGHVSRVFLDAEAKKDGKTWWSCHDKIGQFYSSMLGICLIVPLINRIPFSLVMAGVKE